MCTEDYYLDKSTFGCPDSMAPLAAMEVWIRWAHKTMSTRSGHQSGWKFRKPFRRFHPCSTQWYAYLIYVFHYCKVIHLYNLTCFRQFVFMNMQSVQQPKLKTFSRQNERWSHETLIISISLLMNTSGTLREALRRIWLVYFIIISGSANLQGLGKKQTSQHCERPART
jgi:hypothetical protein